MHTFADNIEKLTRDNESFRRVLYTGKHTQLVAMSIPPSEEIGEEVHKHSDQFFRFEQGVGRVIIDGVATEVMDGSAAVVPAGVHHNVINVSSSDPLKLYTLYSPPHHKDGVVHETKHEAMSDNDDHL